MLTVVQKNQHDCFYSLNHSKIHLVLMMAMNPMVNDDVRWYFAISNLYQIQVLSYLNAIHQNDGTTEHEQIRQCMMHNVNLSSCWKKQRGLFIFHDLKYIHNLPWIMITQISTFTFSFSHQLITVTKI